MFLKNFRWLPAFLWGVFILIASTWPVGGVPSVKIPHLDKLVHFSFYFIFCGLTIFGLSKKYKSPTLFILIFSMLLSTCYGVVIEYLQEAMKAGRSGELLDAIANILGASAISFFYKPLINKILDK